MGLRRVSPTVVKAVDPGNLHATCQSALAVEFGVIAHMQNLRYPHTRQTCSFFKNAGVRLGHAERLGTDTRLKIARQTCLHKICRAIRDGHQRPVLT